MPHGCSELEHADKVATQVAQEQPARVLCRGAHGAHPPAVGVHERLQGLPCRRQADHAAPALDDIGRDDDHKVRQQLPHPPGRAQQ
eukprot:CAMPEP_0204551712 /NCGR_PEP_ID=MMETSP0661-20131031/26099_1 /ASSEMBLY_ACC=CAM_ASM_000606 /TAXON_ID=109239 /ORGANISM="Alexandrium margalefi, Strain AMGDE01CS-322" /LENGTH=85 /DNA_ID=CAMNT_0051558705 /DNA_START=40 /DNA_END=297 /DNA_ORIENTATION=-